MSQTNVLMEEWSGPFGGVPPWERDRLPLIVCGDDLVWVPGLGVDVRYRAAKNRRGVLPEWRKMPR